MHALRRAAFAAPRQLPLRAAPKVQSWQPVARLFSSESLGSEQKPASDDTAAAAQSDANDLSPEEQARMDKAIGSSLKYYEKRQPYKPSKPTPATSKPAPASSKPASNKPAASSTKSVPNTSDPSTWAPATPPKPSAVPLGNHHMANSSQRPPGHQMEIPSIDWTSEYYGAGAFPVSERQYLQLTEPLRPDDVEVKPDGVVYLPEIKYRRKLNQVFGPMGWSLIPKGEPVVKQNIVTREYVLVADSRFVSQAQGENNYFTPEGLPSAVEGCKSNALMRCCKDLGIASELWDPIFVRNFRKLHMVEAWVEHAVNKKKRTLWFRKGAVEYVYPWKKTTGSPPSS